MFILCLKVLVIRSFTYIFNDKLFIKSRVKIRMDLMAFIFFPSLP